MNRTSLRHGLLMGGLLLASSCNLGTKQSAGIRAVDDLVSHVEAVQIEAQVSSQSVFQTLRGLHPIVSGSFEGDVSESYVAFVLAVDGGQAQAQRFRAVIDPLKVSAAAVFDRWENNLTHFSGEAMRARSQERMDASRAEYNAVLESAESALAQLHEFNAGMRDIALFLGVDLNPSSVASIEDSARGMASRGKDIRDAFDDCAETASRYVLNAAPLGQVQVQAGATTPAGE